MKFQFSLKFRGHKLGIYCTSYNKIEGVNSTTRDGLHVIMLDCDSVNIRDLKVEVVRLQEEFRLSHAVIMSTGRADSYHVYFHTAVSFHSAMKILLDCKYNDKYHVIGALRREHITLRLSPKDNRGIYKVEIILSRVKPNITARSLFSKVEYEQ